MIPQIRPAELPAWIAQARARGAEPLILDVREPAEWQTASVRSDALVLTIPMGVIPQKLDDIDRSRPVACLCHHGARSQRVASFLAAQGYPEVVNIAGGIDAWALELDPAVPRY